MLEFIIMLIFLIKIFLLNWISYTNMSGEKHLITLTNVFIIMLRYDPKDKSYQLEQLLLIITQT